MFERGELIYEGKAKRVYEVVNEPSLAWLEFKDSLTAFNAQKKGQFENKGLTNAKIASCIFQFLHKAQVRSHWVQDIKEANMVVLRLDMIPLEVVVRNRVAGSLAKKFALQEGVTLAHPLVEFYYKDDALADPFVSDEQIAALQLVKDLSRLPDLKKLALQVNDQLVNLFASIDIDLIDFKIEVGVDSQGELYLADEITPDSCRLWARETGEKLDKDRFRQDLGRVKESYEFVLQKLSERISL